MQNHTQNAPNVGFGYQDFQQRLSARHIAIVGVFLVLVRLKITNLSLAIPAIALASYHEWMLHEQDGISTVKYTVLGLLVPWLLTFTYRLIEMRRKFRDLPGPPHSFLFGHLPTMAEETMKFPPDVHNHVVVNHLAEKYDLREPGLFYIDTYPIMSEPLMVIISPEVAAQVAQTESYPKHPVLNGDFGRAIGPRGIVGQEGELWKELRTMFNPGFSQANLLTMVPMMVEEATIFVNRLCGITAGDGFIESTDNLASAITVDVIGRALLGIRFNAQSAPNELVTSVVQASRLVRSLSDMSPERLNIWRIFKLRYHEAVSNRKISNILSAKWSSLAAEPEKARSSNIIFDIAMAKYMKRGGDLKDGLTADFLELMRDNVKTFIFAGHDTTSSVISYALFELSRHPDILHEVREEHDNVLGLDPEDAGKRLTNDPRLANALPLTTAIIREVLRIWVPATTVRIAPKKGSTVIGRDGKIYPTGNCMVWSANNIPMKDPSLFPLPYEFIPQRFLPEKSTLGAIPKNAYRPFEKGARDCLGQELALLESRIVLALTVRKFDFKEAYEELDRRLGRTPKMFPVLEKVGGRAYQVLFTTAKPKDGMPMWVSKRNE